jgi:hypothetical protein
MAPLFPYLGDLAIINGIMSVETSSSHEVNRQYMSTGSLGIAATYMPFLIAKARGGTESVGYLTDEQVLDGGYAKKHPLSDLDSLSAKPSEFAAVFAEANSKNGGLGHQADLIRRQSEDSPLVTQLQTAREKLLHLQTESSELRNVQMSPPRLALAGFTSGYIQSAICEFSQGFDTHSAHQNEQTSIFTQTFTGLSKIIKTMKNTVYQGPGADGKKTLFDLTTVILTSDFSRTSDMQGPDGTDHNQFNNSCIMFGKGIAGGQVIGQSAVYLRGLTGSVRSTRLHANLFDFNAQRSLSKEQMVNVIAGYKATGKLSKRASGSKVDYIYPESIWWTIAQSMGVKTLDGLETSPVLRALLKK